MSSSSMSSAEAAALRVILEANGLTPEQYEHRPHEIHLLELFHQNFPRLLSLSGFTHLTELRITRQPLTDLTGFPSLPHLERLWLSENRLTSVNSLAMCTLPRIKELYLYSNRLSSLGRALGAMTGLEVLWVNENELGRVEGVEGLRRLRELNYAGNGVREVGTALDGNGELEVLNLSGNRIGFLREVVHLRRLAKLKRLAFADPLFGDNPVARLANYSTFVVYQLPNLQYLDACAIAPEARQAAAASFLKRRMFYSMRIKASRRLAAAATRIAGEVLAERLAGERAALKDRCLARADEVSSAAAEGGGAAPASAAVTALDAEIARVRARIASLEAMHAACCAEIDRVGAELAGRMLLELQTGGNIRLEEGKPSDVWYSSCADLLESRFVPSELGGGVGGVSAVRVLRVLRVHNRFLRGRFDERLESLVETSEPGHRHFLEYLFHGQDPRFPDELFRVCEEGFHSAEEGASLGIDGAVVLSGSVAGADAARIAAHRLQQRQASPPVPDAQRGLVSAAPGCLVVAKVFLGRSAQEKQPSTVGPKAHAGRLSPALQFAGAGERHPPVLQEDYPGVDSVQRPEGKTWFVFDHRLVLPEYLVYFDYLPTRPLPAAPAGLVADLVVARSASSSSSSSAAGAEAALDGQALAQPVQHFWSRVNGSDEPPADPAPPQQQHHPHPHAVVLGKTSLGRSRWPVPALDPGSLTELDLHDCGLVSMAPLADLRELRSLVLSFNAIPRVCGLEALQSLTHLDLSHNVVHEVSPCPAPCLALTSLRLEGNELASLTALALLLSAAPSLGSLALEGNPVCSDRMYRRTVLARAERLKTLDGVAVSQEERVAAAEEAGGITDRVLRVCCESGSVAPSTLWQPSRTLGAHLQTKRLSTAQAGAGWKDAVEEANLSGRRIQRIENLGQLPRLRRLVLADNEITEVGDGLAACRALEDLVLEGNLLTSLAGLGHLSGLRRLEVGRNQLRGPLARAHLAGLSGLTQLSIEDNAITSLAALAQLPNLAEVYASNNKIATAADAVLPLAELQHLVILDLTGNPVASSSSSGYRLHAVFTLKKLRVLDAVSVEPEELARAREEHGGRLTEEMVKAAMARVVHGRLDLSGLKLRRVDCLAGGAADLLIPGVWDLALDNNNLTTARMAPLAGLANVRSLGLSHNKLAAATPADPSSAPAQPALPPMLELLDAGYNGLSSISQVLPAAGAQYLRTLVLHGNEITRLEGLEGLPSLEKLVLNSCRVRSFSQGILAKVPALTELHLEGNGLKSLAGLEGSCNVRALFLGLNRIADFAEFDRLALWGRLEQISVVQNPVARKKDHRLLLLARIPSLLVIDERIVDDIEKERAAHVSMAEPIPPNIVLAPSAKAQANLRIATLSFEPGGPSGPDPASHGHQPQYQGGGQTYQPSAGRPLFKPSPR